MHQRAKGEWTLKEVTRASLVEQAVKGLMTVREVAEQLQVSERHTWRLKARLRSSGIETLRHQNRGRKPHNAIPEAIRQKAWQIFQTWRSRCDGAINAAHFSDILRRDHQIVVSRQTTWRWIRQRGAVSCPRRPQRHRMQRERRGREGELLFLDGSYHRWFGLDSPPSTLVLCTDDATSAALWGVFVDEESTNACFEVAYHVFTRHGLPGGFYLDRASQFITTRHEGTHVKQSASSPTEWQKAMQALGIRCLFASSPQARGRGERMNGTLQQRLVYELQYRHIRTHHGATRFLNETFLPEINSLYAVPPQDPRPAWRTLPNHLDLKTVLCTNHFRTATNDNTVRYNKTCYQILPHPAAQHFSRATITLQHWFDDSIHLFHPKYGELKYTQPRKVKQYLRKRRPTRTAPLTKSLKQYTDKVAVT